MGNDATQPSIEQLRSTLQRLAQRLLAAGREVQAGGPLPDQSLLELLHTAHTEFEAVAAELVQQAGRLGLKPAVPGDWNALNVLEQAVAQQQAARLDARRRQAVRHAAYTARLSTDNRELESVLGPVVAQAKAACLEFEQGTADAELIRLWADETHPPVALGLLAITEMASDERNNDWFSTVLIAYDQKLAVVATLGRLAPVDGREEPIEPEEAEAPIREVEEVPAVRPQEPPTKEVEEAPAARPHEPSTDEVEEVPAVRPQEPPVEGAQPVELEDTFDEPDEEVVPIPVEVDADQLSAFIFAAEPVELPIPQPVTPPLEPEEPVDAPPPQPVPPPIELLRAARPPISAATRAAAKATRSEPTRAAVSQVVWLLLADGCGPLAWRLAGLRDLARPGHEPALPVSLAAACARAEAAYRVSAEDLQALLREACDEAYCSDPTDDTPAELALAIALLKASVGLPSLAMAALKEAELLLDAEVLPQDACPSTRALWFELKTAAAGCAGVDVLGAVADLPAVEAYWRALEGQREQIDKWLLAEAQSDHSRFDAASKVWCKWVERGGLVRGMFDLLDRHEWERLAEASDHLRDGAWVGERLDETDLQLRGAQRQRFNPIKPPADTEIKTVAKATADDLDKYARLWAERPEALSDSARDYGVRQVKAMADVLRRLGPDSVTELQAVAEDEELDPLAALWLGCAAGRYARAVDRLLGLFSGRGGDQEPRLTPKLVLAEMNRTVVGCPLDADGQGATGNGDRLLDTLLTYVGDGGCSPEEAFGRFLAAGDTAGAEQLIYHEAALTGRQYLSRLDQVDELARLGADELERGLERVAQLGLLSEATVADARLRLAEPETRDEQLSAWCQEHEAAFAEALQDLRIAPEWVGDACQRWHEHHDPGAACDYVALGLAELPPGTVSGAALCSDFYPREVRKLAPMLTALTPADLELAAREHTLALPRPVSDDGWELLERWAELKRLGPGSASPERLQALLDGLGWQNAVVLRGFREDTVQVRIKPLDSLDDCPVPSYGSGAAGTYVVLPLWSPVSPTAIARAVAEVAGDAAPLVFVLGVLNEDQRRGLAEAAREPSTRLSALVVDDVMVAWLAGERRDQRRSALFAAGLPFIAAEPFAAPGARAAVETLIGRGEALTALRRPGVQLVYGAPLVGVSSLLRLVEERTGEYVLRASLRPHDQDEAPDQQLWALLGAEAANRELPVPTNADAAAFSRGCAEWLNADDDRSLTCLVDDADDLLREEPLARLGELAALAGALGERFTLVLAGHHRVARAALAEPEGVGRLPVLPLGKEAAVLLTRPLAALGYRLGGDALARALALLGGWPALVQAFGQRLLARARDVGRRSGHVPPQPITVADVESVWQCPDDQPWWRATFDRTGQLEAGYQALLEALATTAQQHGGLRRGTPAEELLELVDGPPAELAACLSELAAMGLVHKAPNAGLVLACPAPAGARSALPEPIA